MTESVNWFTFTSLEEIPLTELIDASIPKMDEGTYDWSQINATTEEQKLSFIHTHLTHIIENENGFCCAVSVDDEVLLAIFGTRCGEDFIEALTLGRPNRDGSRSYIYREDVRSGLHNLLEDNEFTKMWGFMPDTSSLKDALNQRNDISDDTYGVVLRPDNTRMYVHWQKPSET